MRFRWQGFWFVFGFHGLRLRGIVARLRFFADHRIGYTENFKYGHSGKPKRQYGDETGDESAMPVCVDLRDFEHIFGAVADCPGDPRGNGFAR